MAGLRNIKIGADISGAKQSLKELSNILNSKEFAGKGAQIVDTKHIDFVKKEGAKAVDSMNKELKKQDELLVKLQGIAEDQNKSDKIRQAAADRYNRVMKKRLDLAKDLLRTEKDLSDVGEKQSKLQRFGGRAQGLGGIMGKIPGMGRLGGMLGRGGAMAAGGMGLGSMAMMGLGGAVLGAGAFGVSRAIQGNQVFKEGTQTRQTLRGLNVRDVSGRSEELQALGMSPEEVRQAQMQRAQSLGGDGASQNDILQTARISKLTGVSMEQFGGAAEALRSNLGVEGGQKAFAKLQASLLASGVEDALGPYLEQAANMLTAMNENGLSLSDEAVTLFSAAMGDGRKISAERASKIITGIDSAIKGAQGEQAGMIDFIMSAGGVQGKGLLGQQLVREGGITGFGTRKDLEGKGLGSEELDAFGEAGMFGENMGSKGRVKALVDFYEQQRSEQGTLGALSTMQGAVGGRGLVDTAQIMETLRTALESGDQQKIDDTLEKMEEGKMPLDEQQVKKLEGIISSVDGTNQAIDALRLANLDLLGERIQPTVQATNRFLNSIDKNIGKILGWLPGVTTEAEQREEDISSFIEKAASGEASVTDLKSMDLTPEERADVTSRIEKRMAGQQGRSEMLAKRSADTEKGGGWLNKKMDQWFNKPAKQDADAQVAMLKLMLDELKKGNDNTGKLANKRDTRIPGGSKTGKRSR